MKKIKLTKTSTFDPSEEDYTESGTPEERAYADSVSGLSADSIFGVDEDDEESEMQPDGEAAELSEPDAEKREAALQQTHPVGVPRVVAKSLHPPINPPPPSA